LSVVFGIFNRNKKAVKSSIIAAMNEALDYWDADDRGNWGEGSIRLGHRMLWSTPESKLEHLPYSIHSKNQTFVITIDARLDNRKELADKLGMSDIPLENLTDSKLVLAAYEKWGEKCPKYLLGDFVFAIWDTKKEQLFCARDHVGIKPFYYHLSDDLFIFSNDIRGLIAHPEIGKKYNARSIAMFLTGCFGFYDEKGTFFKEIRKLPAATSIVITKEYVSESVYWDIENISEIRYDTYEKYTQKLKELLIDAVKVRLRTSYPVASHLSGGIDSSAIAVLAARELEKRKQLLYTFNWIETPLGEYDPAYPEWGFAIQLTNLENIEQKNIRLTPEFIAEMYDKVDITKDDITYYWSEYLVREEAEKYKIRTILSGWGGDELISYHGNAYISGLFRQGHFIKAIKKIFALYKYDNKKFIYLRTIKRSVRELIYPFFYKQMSGAYQERKSDFDPFEFTQDQFSSSVKKFSFTDMGFYPGVHNDQKALFNRGHILQRIENWASSAMSNKIEYSYPLLDKRIVEFALAVPEDLFAWKDGHKRYLFRNTVSDFLPENIAWMAKNSEPEHGKVWEKLWIESLRVWMQKNEKTPENRNSYVYHSKIIKRIKMYFTNKQNGTEDKIIGSWIVISILLLNLKNKDC
jgi:asparagine synthase (glutamine-hydrolysing)